jgi:glycosyltransferase involved in cell wall biosynthesis
LQIAQGEFIAILDADDISAPERLESQISFLDAHPEVGLVGCAVHEHIDETGMVLHCSRLPEDNVTIQRSLMGEWCFLHSSLMFRRSLYERVGGYRVAFEPVEDHDFVLRLAELCEVRNVGERLVQYRLRRESLSVKGHRYTQERRSAALRLAMQRRSGHPESFDFETVRESGRKHKWLDSRVIRGPVQQWRDSLYAAQRYYDIGLLEMKAGNNTTGRRCFVRSLHMNRLFIKSWFSLLYLAAMHAGGRLTSRYASHLRRRIGALPTH